jgi:hypothetical protein
MPMNDGERFRVATRSLSLAGLPICNQAPSNGALLVAHQSPGDGGFDEDAVMVALSLPVAVVHA